MGFGLGELRRTIFVLQLLTLKRDGATEVGMACFADAAWRETAVDA